MSTHFAWLVLPSWVHWLPYLPTGVTAVLLCLSWPAELLNAHLASGRRYLGEWPDDYDHLELAQLEDYAASQETGLEALRSLSFP